jgi:hypothetical protein
MIITKKYVFASIIICFVSVGVYFNIQKILSVANSDKTVDDISAKQLIETDGPITLSKSENILNPSNQKKQQPTTIDRIPVVIVQTQFPPEVDSAAGLLKISSHVFLGKVLGNIGDDSGHPFPSTRFEVEIEKNIKGEAAGKIFLNQLGVGYSERNKKFYVREGDIKGEGGGAVAMIDPTDIYLKVGAVYLFSANYSTEKGTYGISVPPYDRELITTDADLTDAQVLSAAENNPRVREFMNAAGIKTLQSAYQ